MKCDEFLSAVETGGFLGRVRARIHALRCPRCVSQREKLAEAMHRWASPEPLSPEVRRVWERAADESVARPSPRIVWKPVATGAVVAVLALLVVLLMPRHDEVPDGPSGLPTAGNESRHLSPITVEEIDPAQGYAQLSEEVQRLDVELKTVQERIEKIDLQQQIAATLDRFGQPSAVSQ